jgi:putative flavoprotein involved in K+ transport
VETDRGIWVAENVVVATGHCDRARVPGCAADVPADVHQTTSLDYRNPDQLPPGGVLVVGASASGVQLADELRRSGRRVALAVGRHRRLPRRYRGLDIMTWLDRLGVFDRRIDEVGDAEEARREPSVQLVGRRDHRDLDLAVLRSRGVELAGHLLGFDGGSARFAGDLPSTTAEADQGLRRLLARVDERVELYRSEGALEAAEPIPPVPVADALESLQLRQEGFGSILWATGYRRSYPWLHAPVLDPRGEIRHRQGCTPAGGLYVLGLQFMIRRRSSFLDGVGRDAEELAARISCRSCRRERRVA